MKNAYLRALTISVMIAFAPLALASAQTDISVSDHSWIKGQQDALAAIESGWKEACELQGGGPQCSGGLPVRIESDGHLRVQVRPGTWTIELVARSENSVASLKRPAAEQMLASLGFSWSQAAAMGDDWPDLPVMRRCALACAPANAHVEARHAAHHTTVARGGEGAAREFCDLLLVASGRYAALLADYTQ